MNRRADALGIPQMVAPAIAHRLPDVYRDGERTTPRDDDFAYKRYTFVGRMAVNDTWSTRDARDAALAKFGPGIKVFRTARWWVVYRD